MADTITCLMKNCLRVSVVHHREYSMKWLKLKQLGHFFTFFPKYNFVFYDVNQNVIFEYGTGLYINYFVSTVDTYGLVL